MKKLFKNPFISALLIGILATALWEKFISPFCSFIYASISSLIEKYITTYTDKTYQKISSGFNDSFSIYVFILVVGIYFTAMLILNIYPLIDIYFEHSIRDSESIKNPISNSKLYEILSIVIFLLITLLYIYLIGNLIYINNCKTISLCNLEIISPYISDIEYKQLKSTFYSIQTKDDYINFTEAINKIGEQYSLDLKK